MVFSARSRPVPHYFKDQTTALMVAAGTDYVEGQDKYGRRSYSAYWETIQ